MQVRKLVHVNQLVADFASTTATYVDAFAAREYWRGYDEEQNRDANLFVIGDLCVELFAPRDTASMLGSSLARFGPSWHSFEWQVPDLDKARAELAAYGVRITTDRPGSFLMTHPADCHGMLLELCPLEMPGDPRVEQDWSPAPWRDEHPLGIVGLGALSIAVRDAPGGADWLVGLVDGAEITYREPRGEIDADAVGVRLADHVVEFVQARGADGPVAQYVRRYGQRLRSVELEVLDVERAARHLVDHGLQVVVGSRVGAVAVAEDDAIGVRWEFAPAR
jgi:4-hydroxyphenylpyruvate dioxygenase-like putative hemolysin